MLPHKVLLYLLLSLELVIFAFKNEFESMWLATEDLVGA
jgi:hypothetical protein